MRILEKTPNQLKIKYERHLERSLIAIPLSIMLIVIIGTPLFLLQGISLTLSCKKNDNKVIKCEYQEASLFGLMEKVNFSFEGLELAKPSSKESKILLLTSYGRLTTDLGYNSSYEAVSAEIDDFVKNPKKTSLKIHRNKHTTEYGLSAFVLLVCLSMLIPGLVIFLAFNPIFSKIYTFDKKSGKAIFAERKLFSMKVEEYPINEIVAVRIAGEISVEGSYYQVYLVMHTGQELLLTNFSLLESQYSEKMAHNVQEIVDTLCSFLNLQDSQKITNFNERSPKFIKIKKSTPTKLAIAEPKNLTMLILCLAAWLSGGSLMLAHRRMLPSSRIEAIVSCDRQKNRCEIRDGYKAKIQHFAASQLQRAQMYMTVGYFADEVYSLELIASEREQEKIFSISIYKHGKSSYQKIEEIVKQINAFINNPKFPLLKITIWQGTPEIPFLNTAIIFGGVLMLANGIFLFGAIVRVRRTCTFDKNSGRLLLKTPHFLLAKVTEYPLSEIRKVRIEQNVGCEVVLVMNSGDRFPIIPSYWYLPKYKAEEIAESIRAFLNLKSLREL